jgi:predicted esterase
MLAGKYISVLLMMVVMAQGQTGQTEWIGGASERVKAEIFRSADAGAAPVLVVVLHGDAPFVKPSYQYVFAANAVKNLHGVVVAALLRPGYTDKEGDTSDGDRGNTTADNYTPEVLDRLDVAIQRLKEELHPSAVVLVGHSGGAAISADLIARDQGLANAVLLVSCSCDVPAFREHMKTVAPSPLWDAPVRSISPLDVVGGISKTMRIGMVVGEKDNVAPPALTERYCAALKVRDIKVDVTVLSGKGHEILLDAAIIQKLSILITSLHGMSPTPDLGTGKGICDASPRIGP